MIMQLVVQKCELVDISSLDHLLNIKDLEVFLDSDILPADFSGYILHVDQNGLSLSSSINPTASPTRVDFSDEALQYRLQTSKRSEGLLKAIGLDKYSLPLKVMDTTAGLGTDAYIMAAMGCEIMMFEKSAVIAALLEDGLARAHTAIDPVIRRDVGRMSLNFADAGDYLSDMHDKCAASQGSSDPITKPDVIYLDPMFPPRQKTAKVKKDMALLQKLLPINEDIDSLLEKALGCAEKRVVLKRPGKLSKQASPKPDFQVPGKSCHFQVFLIN